MNGRIWLESDGKSGSTFHFTAALRRMRERDDDMPPALSGLPVLLVEDHPKTRSVWMCRCRE
jgi:hypothetical protein